MASGRGTRDREIRECHGRKGCRGFGRGLGWEKGTWRDWDGRKGHGQTGMGERDVEGLGWQVETPQFGGEQVRWCLEEAENTGDV